MTELEDSVLIDDADGTLPVEVTVATGPDRADAPVSEVTERFLRAVIAKVPLARIEELHLFAPLRQGGTETGIAVIAARVPLLAVDLAPLPDAVGGTAVHAEQEVDSELKVDTGTEVDTEDVSVAADSTDDSPYLSQDNAPGDLIELLASEGFDDEAIDDEIGKVAVQPVLRHTVYTARYRLVLKGPERGTWEADVVDEADAPLITVEMVVRGVQRRAGEETEILRYTDRQIARALRMEWPLPAA